MVLPRSTLKRGRPPQKGMESGERITSQASPVIPSSSPTFSATSVASVVPKGNLSSGGTSLSSTITSCGHLFRASGDQLFNLSSVSSAFSMVSHPVFGLHTATSGHSEFGGLGTLGAPTALAHPRLSHFPEWWRAADAHTRAASTFFPPLMGIQPLFAPSTPNHDSTSFHSKTSGKDGRGVAVEAITRAINGNSATPASTNCTAILSTNTGNSSGQMKTPTSGGGSRECSQELNKAQLLDNRTNKLKLKKSRKEADESSSNSDSDSHTSSESSSEGITSSDSDDMEEDQSIEESDDSDSETEAQHKKTTVLMHCITDLKTDGRATTEKTQEKRTHQQIPLVSDPQTTASFQPQQKQTQVMSQQLPFIFQSSQVKEESVNKHTSVIQSVGLVTNANPLGTNAKKESHIKPLSTTLDLSKAGNSVFSVDANIVANDTRTKKDHLEPTFPVQIKKNQDVAKHQKKPSPTSTSSDSIPACTLLTLQKHSSIENSHSNPFLTNALLGNRQPNGVIHCVSQDLPLVLASKSECNTNENLVSSASTHLVSSASTHFYSPLNLTTCTKKCSTNPTSVVLSTSSGVQNRGKETPVCKLSAVKTQHNLHTANTLVDNFRGIDSDIASSKDSDESNEEDNDEEDDDEDSDNSHSGTPSNSESDTEDSEEEEEEDDDDDDEDDDDKDPEESDTDTEGEKTPLKLDKTIPIEKCSSTGLPLNSTPLNLKITNTPGSAPAALCTESQLLDYINNSSPLTASTPCGSLKRRRLIDERDLRIPLQYGWQRETRIRNVNERLQGEVSYITPCGKKLKQYPEVMKYLCRNGIMDISRHNFSFSAKLRVGDFYEARDGPQGMEWCLLNQEEVIPRIRAMEGRRGRPPNPERQCVREESRLRHRKGRPPNVASFELLGNNDAKMLRKIQAQEIARQAAQMKLLRKLQKQEQTRAAKEAKKQQAIMVAEEKRKQKEQIKILKQQEKIKRIQQIRVEKELRAQQILEAKQKKKEEAANAKLLEAEKRIKEKELRRQHAIIMKHQELERHRLDMVWERERRRQHVMLMKAVEARKKTEEKERIKQEKKDEKRMNKERRLELRRLELEMAKELKKPTEDMCLGDQKPLPELLRIPNLILSGSTFSDCLMVVQFLRNFGKVLGFDLSTDIPSLSILQEGLINRGSSLEEVQDLLVRLLSAAVCDPGLPPGYKAKTALGEHLINIGINRENVSEILQIFMEAHCGQTELTESLKTKAFQAHTPSEKASVLAFLVNELACSKSVVSEIDKSIDHMSNLRRDKWMVEGKLRKLRTIHALKTGKKDTSVGDDIGEGQHLLDTPSPGLKQGRKAGDSDYDDDDDDDDDSEDPADEEEDDEEDKDEKRGKRVDPCEDEEDEEDTTSVEELEKQIEKLLKQQGQFRKKLFESSHSLRSMMFGQDRYRRRYWVLPQCGGIFVEGMESGEGMEEITKEKEKQKKAENILIKEESDMSEENINGLHGSNWELTHIRERGNTNLFLQKPGSFSKLSKLLEVAKMSEESDSLLQKTNGSSANRCTLPYQNSTGCNIQQSISQNNFEKPDCNHLFTPGASVTGKIYTSPLVANDQLLKALTETSRQWFSLLPRTPCDGILVTRMDLPAVSASGTSLCRPQSHSPSPAPSPAVCSTPLQNAFGLNQYNLPPLQMNTGLTMMSLQLCGWPPGILTSNLPFASPVPCLGPGVGLADENGHSFVTDITFNKSESPMSQNESLICTPGTVEVPKAVDYPSPRPIPDAMQFGWWRISDLEELKALLKVLHHRGIREKSLQKQIQKHLDYITHACFRNRDVDVIELSRHDNNQITRDIVENWSVEDQAMEIDMTILQQVEDLERRVASASLQIKGWIYPEPASEREDLVYYEHKSINKSHMELEGQHSIEEGANVFALERRSDNPLDIAVTRLTELERNIERRYLKSPLSTTIQIKLDNVGTVTVPAPAPSISGDGDGPEDDIAPGLRVWRKAILEARSAAQVSLCIQQLNRSIAWEKSIMKVYCQICRKGDNEELLLLCDGCDKGCHTYCHKPKITTIPEGDWFCPACISKASGQQPKVKKALVKGKRSNEHKRVRSLSFMGDTEDEDSATIGSPTKKGGKEGKKRKADDNSVSHLKQESSPCFKKPKTTKDTSKDLTACSIILYDMEAHQDAWPFLFPVNLKLVPGYKKVIKKPMDFSTIREKLSSGQYTSFEAFALDIRLVFDNCETFNEDDSEIGRAGHNMRMYFENKWTEMFKVS
ncbi:bromodomain adjacent to zinc finger domain protein 2B isoform X4 [Pleurodeles waltl]|uniref:bromodomain adjacent to zinc finger domain protein 2B isoform X4 n=1 Tax=Pleurodeles waltl TaxID=8319 RepID=UPI003709A26E